MFSGEKSYEELTRYCKALDVAIIPFVINGLTKSVNPIKLREYLAAGLEVVSANLPEVESYDGFVRISKDEGEFIRNIELSLAGRDNQEKRKRSRGMANEDWKSKVTEIRKIVSSSR